MAMQRNIGGSIAWQSYYNTSGNVPVVNVPVVTYAIGWLPRRKRTCTNGDYFIYGIVEFTEEFSFGMVLSLWSTQT